MAMLISGSILLPFCEARFEIYSPLDNSQPNSNLAPKIFGVPVTGLVSRTGEIGFFIPGGDSAAIIFLSPKYS